MTPQSTVWMTGDEPVLYQLKSSVRAHIPKFLNRECLKMYREYGRVLPVLPSRLLELASVIRQSSRRSVMISQLPDQPDPRGYLCLRHQESDIQRVPPAVGTGVVRNRSVVPHIQTNNSVVNTAGLG